MPGSGGLEGRERVGGENVDLLPFGTVPVALGIGVSGSSSNNWEILAAAAAEYGWWYSEDSTKRRERHYYIKGSEMTAYPRGSPFH